MKKLFHLHLEGTMGNQQTLICKLVNGSIRYTFYQGTSDSGMGLCLTNIQFYKYTLIDGQSHLHWDNTLSLPVENLDEETEEEFKNRVLSMLDHSTNKVIHEVKTQVTFGKGD